jgi:hypothetical protein
MEIPSSLTVEEGLLRLRQIADRRPAQLIDLDGDHIAADNVLLAVLTGLGHHDLVASYKELAKDFAYA